MFVASIGFTVICSSACRRRVQSWFTRGLVVLPRLAQPTAEAVASGGASESAPVRTPAISARSSSNETSLPLEGWVIGLPFSNVGCPFDLSRNWFGLAVAMLPAKMAPSSSAHAVTIVATRRVTGILPLPLLPGGPAGPSARGWYATGRPRPRSASAVACPPARTRDHPTRVGTECGTSGHDGMREGPDALGGDEISLRLVQLERLRDDRRRLFGSSRLAQDRREREQRVGLLHRRVALLDDAHALARDHLGLEHVAVPQVDLRSQRAPPVLRVDAVRQRDLLAHMAERVGLVVAPLLVDRLAQDGREGRARRALADLPERVVGRPHPFFRRGRVTGQQLDAPGVDGDRGRLHRRPEVLERRPPTAVKRARTVEIPAHRVQLGERVHEHRLGALVAVRRGEELLAPYDRRFRRLRPVQEAQPEHGERPGLLAAIAGAPGFRDRALDRFAAGLEPADAAVDVAEEAPGPRQGGVILGLGEHVDRAAGLIEGPLLPADRIRRLPHDQLLKHERGAQRVVA